MTRAFGMTRAFNHVCVDCDAHQSIRKNDALRLHRVAHQLRSGQPIRDERNPGLQRDRSQTNQAYSRLPKLPSITWKGAAHTRNVLADTCFQCYLKCVSIVSSVG